MIKLTKTIVFHTKPTSTSKMFDVVGEYPAKLHFEYDVTCKNKKVGNIKIIGEKGELLMKPFVIENVLMRTKDFWRDINE